MAGTPLALYVHIPFCKSRCTYCDFNAYAGLDHLRDRYTAALIAEIRAWGQALGRPPVRTVFFGGGTPTRLEVDHVAALVAALHDSFALRPDAEMTIEANPATVAAPQLRALRALGVNRISLGVQSFDDRLLAPLRRAHTAADAVEAYALARQAGFDNVNLDLIYGLPEQTLANWAETLDRAIALAPEHLSLYCLTIEAGTPLAAAVRAGRVPPPDPDLAAEMYEHAERVLAGAGYVQYEISNWAWPGYACRHNLVYWRNEPYLGVGAGAHSHLGTRRFANIRPPGRYIARALAADALERWNVGTLERWNVGETRTGRWPDEPVPFPIPDLIDFCETVDGALAIAETLMLGLRLNEGVDLAALTARFGADVRAHFGAAIDEARALGLLTEADGRLRLTARGRLLGDEVSTRILVCVV